MSSATQERLARAAADQWGLVTRRQAEHAGVSPATLKRLARGPGGLERLAHGVYLLACAPVPEYADLRAAWLQLDPDVPAWRRGPDQGVVSHRSAARLYGLGDLPADRHDFTLPVRRQSRRPDVRLHQRPLGEEEWIWLHGLPATRPARIASDLLSDREDPAAVGQIVAEALHEGFDYAGRFTDELAPHAAHFGLRRGDGVAVLGWLLDLLGDPSASGYINDARAHAASSATVQPRAAPERPRGRHGA